MKKRKQTKDMFDRELLPILRQPCPVGYGSKAWHRITKMRKQVDHDLDIFVRDFNQEIINEET